MSSSSSDACEFGLGRLFYAACSRDLARFKRLGNELRRSGIKIEDVKDEDGLCALHAAAIGGRTHVCKYLVEEVKVDIDVKEKKFGGTPLHQAILHERFQVAIYLLESGANPNTVTHHRRTACHFAAKKGPRKLLKLLIRKGAEINAMADTGTPFLVAAFEDKKNFVKVLLDNNADPNVISYDLFSPLLASIVVGSMLSRFLRKELNQIPSVRKEFIPLAMLLI